MAAETKISLTKKLNDYSEIASIIRNFEKTRNTDLISNIGKFESFEKMQFSQIQQKFPTMPKVKQIQIAQHHSFFIESLNYYKRIKSPHDYSKLFMILQTWFKDVSIT